MDDPAHAPFIIWSCPESSHVTRDTTILYILHLSFKAIGAQRTLKTNRERKTQELPGAISGGRSGVPFFQKASTCTHKKSKFQGKDQSYLTKESKSTLRPSRSATQISWCLGLLPSTGIRAHTPHHPTKAPKRTESQFQEG